MQQPRRLSKRERRILRQNGELEDTNSGPKLNLSIKDIEPLTENQARTFDAYEDGRNLMLHGSAGVGKSFLALYLGLCELLSGRSDFQKIVLVRSVVPTRDMGFLPGSAKEKALVYEAPYYAICTKLFGRGDAYDLLKQKAVLEFMTTSFVRSVDIDNAIIIVDECQNLTFHELDSIITRVGKNSRIVFCGDFMQSDFTRDHEKSGVQDFMKVIKSMKSFSFVEFTENDIVRSNLVAEYIKTKNRLGVAS